MPLFSILDVIALGVFIVAWGGYAYLIELTGHGRGSLNARMNAYR
jgi:uncharacterized membrane protein